MADRTSNQYAAELEEIANCLADNRGNRVPPSVTTVMQVRDLARRLAAETKARTDWGAEIEGALDLLGEHAIRVREGGGPENLAASLALTFAKLDPRGRAAEKTSALPVVVPDSILAQTEALPSQ